MGSSDGRGSRWWIWVTITAVAAAAGLAGLAWFFMGQSRENADQYASVFAFLLTYLVAAMSLLAWLARRALTALAPSADPMPSVTMAAGRDAYTAREMTFHRDSPVATDGKEPSA